jgi:hypothetical protein
MLQRFAGHKGLSKGKRLLSRVFADQPLSKLLQDVFKPWIVVRRNRLSLQDCGTAIHCLLRRSVF